MLFVGAHAALTPDRGWLLPDGFSGMGTLTNSGNRSVFLFGGKTRFGSMNVRTYEVLYLNETNTLRVDRVTVEARRFPAQTYQPCVAGTSEHGYVIGGLDASNTAQNFVYQYRDTTGWVARTNAPVPVHRAGCAVGNNLLALYTRANQTHLHLMNLTSFTWSVVLVGTPGYEARTFDSYFAIPLFDTNLFVSTVLAQDDIFYLLILPTEEGNATVLANNFTVTGIAQIHGFVPNTQGNASIVFLEMENRSTIAVLSSGVDAPVFWGSPPVDTYNASLGYLSIGDGHNLAVWAGGYRRVEQVASSEIQVINLTTGEWTAYNARTYSENSEPSNTQAVIFGVVALSATMATVLVFLGSSIF